MFALVNDGNEEVDDLQYAWEALDYARKIYDAHPGENSDVCLAQVYLRTGDHKRFGGFYAQAIEEYKKCMELRTACLTDDYRALAETHFMIAITHIYNSGEEDTDCLVEKKKALSHYKNALKTLQMGINKEQNSGVEKRSDENPNSVRYQQQGTIDELKETIEALQLEIEHLCPSSSQTNSSTASTASIGSSKPIGCPELPSTILKSALK